MLPATVVLSSFLNLSLESLAWHAPLRGLDLAVTEYGIAHTSAIERNPFGQSSGARAALTVAGIAGASWLDKKLDRHWAKWVFRVGHVAMTAYVVQHNVGQLGRINQMNAVGTMRREVR